jgi:pimeloyl-ACP methyl ester carboxylesterase
MQVYEAWMTYRKIFPRLRLVARNIRSHKIRTHLIFGRYDAVIRTHLGRKFVRITGDQKMLHILPMGHRLINDVTVKYISDHHLWPK